MRAWTILTILALGCGADDPSPSAPGPTCERERDDSDDQPGDDDDAEAPKACEALPEDFPGDAWDACGDDDGRWRLAGTDTPSSAARVAAYEVIADHLWRNPCELTGEDFVQAQLIYAEDGGVGSRVTRRHDAHIEPPEEADCKAADASELWPDYCVGPARIEPLILDAFKAGIEGENMDANAQAIRSGLLWFYFVSAYKEASTCASTKKDCDSAWAYYTGGKQPGETQLGLGAEVHAVSPEVHDAVFSALLALRCWREADDADVAEDAELHAQALGQLDQALNRAWEVLAVPGDVPDVGDVCP